MAKRSGSRSAGHPGQGRSARPQPAKPGINPTGTKPAIPDAAVERPASPAQDAQPAAQLSPVESSGATVPTRPAPTQSKGALVGFLIVVGLIIAVVVVSSWLGVIELGVALILAWIVVVGVLGVVLLRAPDKRREARTMLILAAAGVMIALLTLLD